MVIAVDASCAADAALARFAGWLHGAGATLPGMEIFCSSSGRGVRATRTVHEGEVAASVPLRLLLTHEAALEGDDELRASSVRGTNLIALFLMRQLPPDAVWHRYAAALPKALGTTLFWTEAQLAELQHTELATLSAHRARAVERHHVSLVESGLLGASSSGDFRWALATVWARSHSVELPGGGPQGALCPLIDLFNHHARPGIAPARVEGGAFVLRAARTLRRGEEATVPYGAHGALPNSRLLMDYGFCNNPSNGAAEHVTLTLNASRA
eukprot:5265421-Prymnesium_polylepis.1